MVITDVIWGAGANFFFITRNFFSSIQRLCRPCIFLSIFLVLTPIAFDKSFQFAKYSHNDTNFSLTAPMIRLTQESSTVGNRYIMSRLREPAILSSLKLFLAYLHDQPSSVCFEGYTSTSVKVFLASEGLPVDPVALRAIYYNFHDFYGISSVEVDEDLSTYRTYITSEWRIHQHKIKECYSRYFTADSSKKNF